MTQTPFDGLTVLCRERESQAGCVELCRDPTGTQVLRVRIRKPALQEAVLMEFSKAVPVCLSEGTLDVLLPWREGQTLERWLDDTGPGLGQRRDVCLSLLADLIGTPVGPVLVGLSARTENLRFTARQCQLQLSPQLTDWHPGQNEEDMVRQAALLAEKILTQGQDTWDRRRFPEELHLIQLRCDSGTYGRLEELQQDLAALPDRLLPTGWLLHVALERLRQWAAQYGPWAARAVAAALTVAALLSLAGACRIWWNDQKHTWPGVTRIGGQILSGEAGDVE